MYMNLEGIKLVKATTMGKVMSISEEKLKTAYSSVMKFYDDVQKLTDSVLSKEQEEAVKRINTIDAKLKKHWENNFEKVTKEILFQYCSELFECLNMMRVSILLAAEVENSIRNHIMDCAKMNREEFLTIYDSYGGDSIGRKSN